MVTDSRSALPLRPQEYHHFLRTPRARWWKGALLSLSFVVLYLLVSLLLTVAAVAVDVARERVQLSSVLEGRLTLTPALMLATNLAPALMIPASMLLQWAFFGQRPRWLHSVHGGFRWRLLVRAATFVVPLWVVYVVLTTLLLPQSPTGAFTAESVAMLVVVVVTTPLQAAGEEYGARGLLSRAAGSWASDRRVALVVATAFSAVLFTVAHGAGDPWLISYYFVFAVALSLITWRTGGLEVAVLVHGVNNLFLFVLAVSLRSDLSQTFNRQNGVAGPSMLIAMGMMVLITVVVWWWADRTGVVRFSRPLPPIPPAPPLPPLVRGTSPQDQKPLAWPE